MLTPAEITGQEFEKAVFNGYTAKSVEDFLETVTADYAALCKENEVLKKKIKLLVEKVEEYRSTEDAMRAALLSAQRTGEQLVADSKKRGEEQLEQAETELKRMMRDYDARALDEEARLNAAREETARFVEASERLITQHQAFLSRLSDVRRAAEPSKPPIIPGRASSSSAPDKQDKADKLDGAVSEIDSAVEKLYGASSGDGGQKSAARPKRNRDGKNAAPDGEFDYGEDDEDATTKRYASKTGEYDDPDTTPRPKFDFDNLKFGINFSAEE